MAKILGDDQLNILAEQEREAREWEEQFYGLTDPFTDDDEPTTARSRCPGCPVCEPKLRPFLDEGDNEADLADPFMD